ncbi:XRE family transcriptional regulator [Mesorhizobium sp. BAC0120]|uniref:XRE family transcriptional regulator n=1 Tax=Mesorhizobium sp. BAC0120 TaxID=3090670 RepID=UPI00298C2316|nr:XRE family transcriptional regulator [Mesorhizobium sp. BAC0120]MDW6020596.1 XRE family transcriptional regulator [Mesorhizobium sp. BAC0120]
MSLRENLAVNLRRLCAQHGSIAAVCREMGVNRQQFDRYLSMDALPNRATTARICEYFQIEEAELYRDPDTVDGIDPPARLGRLGGQAGDGSIAVRLFAPPSPRIASGFYQTYFSIPGEPAQILCAITSIRTEGERTTFRRMTGLAETRGTAWSYFMGDHEGVVLERLNWFYFLGLNRRGTKEPTFMSVQWGPFSPEPLLCGHAMIVTPSGPSVTTVVMRAAPKGMSLKSALRSARVYSSSDPAVGPLVELALSRQYMPMPSF